MVTAIMLLALSSQAEAVQFPGCTCEVSGIQQAEWTPEDLCRGYRLSPGDDELKCSELQKRCVRELNSLYPQYGFLDAEIDCQITEDEEGKAELRITVEEGPKYIVGKIDIDVEEGKFDQFTLRERLRIHPGGVCNPQYVTISRFALSSTIAIALADPEFWKAPGHFPGNKYVTDIESTKHPEAEIVNLRYTVRIPPRARLRTDPIWTPLHGVLQTDNITAIFTSFWLRNSLDGNTKLLVGAVDLENETENTLNIGAVSLLAGDTLLEALSSIQLKDLWDGSLPPELPKPEDWPEYQPLKVEGLVARNLVGRELPPSSEAVFAIGFAVKRELPRKLTLEFGEQGNIIFANPAMKAE